MDLPQGTLDLLILKAIGLEPQHGWAISDRIQQISKDALKVQQKSLYPTLHRLERRGWIKAEWGASDNNRKAKYYELTRAGRKQLEAQTPSAASASLRTSRPPLSSWPPEMRRGSPGETLCAPPHPVPLPLRGRGHRNGLPLPRRGRGSG